MSDEYWNVILKKRNGKQLLPGSAPNSDNIGLNAIAALVPVAIINLKKK
jgi:hypothetical protein